MEGFCLHAKSEPSCPTEALGAAAEEEGKKPTAQASPWWQRRWPGASVRGGRGTEVGCCRAGLKPGRRTEASRRVAGWTQQAVGQTRRKGRREQGWGLSLGEDGRARVQEAIGKGTACHFKGICANQF